MKKICVDDFIVGFGYGIGRVAPGASWRWPCAAMVGHGGGHGGSHTGGKMRQLL